MTPAPDFIASSRVGCAPALGETKIHPAQHS